MLKKCLNIVAALAVLVAFSALSQAQDVNSPVGAKHVIWIGSDGFGAHYVNWDELPNLKKMKENGAWTLTCAACCRPRPRSTGKRSL